MVFLFILLLKKDFFTDPFYFLLTGQFPFLQKKHTNLFCFTLALWYILCNKTLPIAMKQNIRVKNVLQPVVKVLAKSLPYYGLVLFFFCISSKTDAKFYSVTHRSMVIPLRQSTPKSQGNSIFTQKRPRKQSYVLIARS